MHQAPGKQLARRQLIGDLGQHEDGAVTLDDTGNCHAAVAQAACDRSIDVQVSRLRRKLEIDAKSPSVIRTVRNGGYIFTTTVLGG